MSPIDRQIQSRPKFLLQTPPGFLVDSSSAARHGIPRQSAAGYLKHGWLERLAPGPLSSPAHPQQGSRAPDRNWGDPAAHSDDRDHRRSQAQWITGYGSLQKRYPPLAGQARHGCLCGSQNHGAVRQRLAWNRKPPSTIRQMTATGQLH